MSFLTFLVLAATILTIVNPWMAVVLALWLAAYVVTRLDPAAEAAPRGDAGPRTNVRSSTAASSMAFTNIVAVQAVRYRRRHEHDFVRDSMQRFLQAVRGLTRAITSVRSAVAIINGVMMASIFRPRW